MQRSLLALGSYFIFLGALMPPLLNQLSTVTFRGDIPPWRTASYFLAVLGALLLLSGIIIHSSKRLDNVSISRAFGYITLLNTIAAVVFITPVLVPTFEFPILITRWPGIYMVAAFFSFIVVGILGSLAWSVLYSNSSKLLNKLSFDRWSVITQLLMYEIGAYCLAFFMFWGGYTGSALSYEGAQDAMVGIVMESNVIPSALFIYTIMFAVVFGIITLLTGSPSPVKEELRSEKGLKSEIIQPKI